jgi:ubiquinone/menaquinone biosynthesis C-methylase UbiE
MNADSLNAVSYDLFLWLGEKRGMGRRRQDLLAGATGRVLEIGAGTGLNARHYPDGLQQLVLTEPVDGMADRLEKRLAREGLDAEVVRAGAERLPFPDASFDTVVSTMVLCTVPDAQAAIDEIRRVLRPGGKLLFIEHVRADGVLGRIQDRLERPWKAFADGCVCTRDTLTTLGDAFGRVEAEPAKWAGMPALVHPLHVGHATTV